MPHIHLAFDISDIVVYAQRHRRVSGIQRVVLTLVRLMAERGHDVVFCDPATGEFFRTDSAALAGTEYSGERLIEALGVRNRRVPASLRYEGRPFKRAYHETRRRIVSALRGGSGRLHGVSAWVPRPGRTRYVVLGAPYTNPRLGDALPGLMAAFDIEPVVFIHDLRPIVAPHYETLPRHALIAWFRSQAKTFRHFLTCSAYTESSLRGLLEAEERPFEWIRHVPLAHEFLCDGEEVQPASLPLVENHFVLTIGSLDHMHKNADGLIAAWAEVARKAGAGTPTLAFAGAHGKSRAKIGAAEKTFPELKGRLHAVNEPSDGELAWLYRNCLYTVFPSLFEGWGLPVGESAWMGKLCVASNRASIPEVLGDGADYFDPGDRDHMVRALLRPIENANYLESRETDIRALELRTWKDVAADLSRALLEA